GDDPPTHGGLMSDESPVSGNGEPQRPRWQVQPRPVGGSEEIDGPQQPQAAQHQAQQPPAQHSPAQPGEQPGQQPGQHQAPPNQQPGQRQGGQRRRGPTQGPAQPPAHQAPAGQTPPQ